MNLIVHITLIAPVTFHVVMKSTARFLKLNLLLVKLRRKRKVESGLNRAWPFLTFSKGMDARHFLKSSRDTLSSVCSISLRYCNFLGSGNSMYTARSDTISKFVGDKSAISNGVASLFAVTPLGFTLQQNEETLEEDYFPFIIHHQWVSKWHGWTLSNDQYGCDNQGS